MSEAAGKFFTLRKKKESKLDIKKWSEKVVGSVSPWGWMTADGAFQWTFYFLSFSFSSCL